MNKNKMVIVIIGFIAVAMVVSAVAFLFAAKRVNRGLPTAAVTIRDHTWHVELARSVMEKSRGLSGRDPLGKDKGMLFIFATSSTQGFWMKDMQFAIDIIWISGGKVIGFEENAQPEPTKSVFTLPIYYSPEPADRVLEVPMGTVAEYGIENGDTVIFSGE